MGACALDSIQVNQYVQQMRLPLSSCLFHQTCRLVLHHEATHLHTELSEAHLFPRTALTMDVNGDSPELTAAASVSARPFAFLLPVM